MRKKLKNMWRKSKNRIHQVNDAVSFILMSVAYFIALSPTAVCMKLFRGDILDRGLGDETQRSYWLPKKFEQQNIKRVQRMY